MFTISCFFGVFFYFGLGLSKFSTRRCAVCFWGAASGIKPENFQQGNKKVKYVDSELQYSIGAMKTLGTTRHIFVCELLKRH